MTVWVLMTAMPPTQGHKRLVEFASEYAKATKQRLQVVVCTQPSEPFPYERWAALEKAFRHDSHVFIRLLNREMSQDATSEGFWDMWKNTLSSFGAKPGDTYIASEVYGKKVAEVMKGKFMPYDPEREMYKCKATMVRRYANLSWPSIIPEFQSYLTRTVTIFGAESTGKSTLAKQLGYKNNLTIEYARPYLENTENVITTESMTDIWKGQVALQYAARSWEPKQFIVQDTDLYSTIGYWEFPHWQKTLGPVPKDLILDARNTQSDLYIITRSNIPFEEDPLRYGGDVREGSDEYWIDVCERYGLNYVVLESDTPHGRADEARLHMMNLFNDHVRPLQEYTRKHNG